MSRENMETFERVARLIDHGQKIQGLEISEERPIGKAILWAYRRIERLEEVLVKVRAINGTECSYHHFTDEHIRKARNVTPCGSCLPCVIDRALEGKEGGC